MCHPPGITCHRTRIARAAGPRHFTPSPAIVARRRPRRLCGDRYPDGDDGFPTLALVTVAATIGLFFVTGHWITERRELLVAPASSADTAS
ncbi:hypothetical protein ABT275_23215 [Streptomyces sp. NPDC001185]|uniref:hypothetical protein n=1 Tax=Streptomyces sp. NPDC001185 TaxID=3154380 RepID=UPI003327D06D